ncbi:hypothetical protein [Legionella sp. WA2024007413]
MTTIDILKVLISQHTSEVLSHLPLNDIVEQLSITSRKFKKLDNKLFDWSIYEND